jgi:hypothetical protein
MPGHGQNQIKTIMNYDNGEHITLAANAMKQAQSLLQRPTTAPKQAPKEVIETPIEKVTPEQPVKDLTIEPKRDIIVDAVTIPLPTEEKIDEKIISSPNVVEPTVPSSTTDKKAVENYTISQYNNPGNIQRVNSKGKLIQWEGLAEGGYGSGQRFSKFKTPEAGIRALSKDITTKLKRHKGDLKLMISEYAPNSENDVSEYLKVVQQYAGIKNIYNEDDIKNLVEGFIRMENKKDLADKYIDILEGKT